MVRRLALLMLLAGLACSPVVAQDVPRHAVRAGLSYHQSDLEQTVEVDEGELIGLDADGAFGAFIAYEFRFSRLLGVEAFVTRAEPEIEATVDGRVEGSEDVEFTAATLGLNIHVFGRGGIDVFVAPVAGYGYYSDDFEDDVVYGAAVGLEFGAGADGFAFTSSVRYLKSTAEFKDANADIDFDPLMISAGVAYRF